VLALVASAAVLAAYFLGRRNVSSSTASYQQLTFERGYAGPARFTRDGNTVVYSASWNGGARQLYAQRSNSAQATPLNLDADVLGITDNGDMAVILKRRFLATWLQRGTLARLPLEGGAPRPILEYVYEADITRDAKEFAVVRRDRGKQRLEFPIGKVLFETSGWITDVRISPDGTHVAFMDHSVLPDDRGAVALVDRQGGVRRLTVFGFRPHGSWPDDPPDTRSLTLPAVPRTTASHRWLRCLPPPDLPGLRKTLVLHSLRGSVSSR